MASLSPLQDFFSRHLSYASLVVSDNAKIHSKSCHRRVAGSNGDGRSHGRMNFSLHSLPSPARERPVCRWESSAEKKKTNGSCCFSPSKPKRLGSFDRTTASSMRRLLLPVSPRILASPESALKQDGAFSKKGLTAPVRKSSFRGYLPPPPPCWSVASSTKEGARDTGPSPSSSVSAREELSEILDYALSHCADLEEELSLRGQEEEESENTGRGRESRQQRCW